MARRVVIATLISLFGVMPVLALPPEAEYDEFVGDEDTVITDNVLGNDSPDDGSNALVVTNFVPPGSGTATISPAGDLTFTPDPHFSGRVSIQYEIKEEALICVPPFPGVQDHVHKPVAGSHNLC